MTYAAVVTARADTTVTAKVRLALEKKAAVVIPTVTEGTDQRVRQVCNLMLSDPVPQPAVDMVLIMLDLTGGVTVTAPTDAQIDTAVDTIWGRLVGLVS
jgi:hypothetical protein